jgi:hypothetical protein
MMTGNVLEALGVLSDEDAISNLLAYCVNASQAFGSAFVSALTGVRSNGYVHVRAYPRKLVPGSGVPDLVLKAESGGQCDLVIVENKLGAEEGERQTERYASDECIRHLKQRLGPWRPTGEWRTVDCIFLTLYPWQKPRSREFKHATYEQLLPAIAACQPLEDALGAQLLRDISDAYSAFYAAGRVRPDDRVSEKLASNGPLDSAFLYFGNLFGNLDYPAGLQAEKIDRSSRLGRLYYVVLLSKERWHPPVEAGLPGFNIHIEPHFDALNSRFSLFLHYEIRDYRPRAKAEKIYGARLQAYEEERQRFTAYLEGVRPPRLQLGGGSNQVGKVRLKLQAHARPQELADAVLSSAEELARVIDGFPGLP